MFENLPSAADAAETYENGQFKKAQAESILVEQEIKRAIELGYKSVTLDRFLHSVVEKRLREKGYTIISGSQYNDDYTSISW